jgi:hypothetical protein
MIDSATVIARIGGENGEPRSREEFGSCPSGLAVWMQLQMLRLLDGSEDSPLLCWKQANPPATLWINRGL